MMRYCIDFDFDCEGEPPRTIICQDPGLQVAHVFESPTLKAELKSGQPGNRDWPGPWSWNPEDWEPGPLAKKIVTLLNSQEGES
jgi:hypothetical protein